MSNLHLHASIHVFCLLDIIICELFRFDMNWLKNEEHRTLEGVKADQNLAERQKNILEKIHKRLKRITIDGPSKTDLKFLQKCYSMFTAIFKINV